MINIVVASSFFRKLPIWDAFHNQSVVKGLQNFTGRNETQGVLGQTQYRRPVPVAVRALVGLEASICLTNSPDVNHNLTA